MRNTPKGGVCLYHLVVSIRPRLHSPMHLFPVLVAVRGRNVVISVVKSLPASTTQTLIVLHCPTPRVCPFGST
jgi:hypothetical protein